MTHIVIDMLRWYNTYEVEVQQLEVPIIPPTSFLLLRMEIWKKFKCS
jgi:hypothetical protein